MKIAKYFFLVIAVVLLSLVGSTGVVRSDNDHPKFRWDIFGPGPARAEDNSKITVTGSGTFEVGEPREVTGGGMWQTFAPDGTTSTGTGTYKVTRLVRFALAPGTCCTNGHAGLVVLRIVYSDGSRGILVVSCALDGTPASVFEGVTATKGFVDYWNREGNGTLFRFLGNDDD